MAIEQLPRAWLQNERKARGLVQPEQVPQVLLSHPQWVCWRYVDRGEGKKPDKQPVNPRTLANAGVHWANTWTSFDEAYSTYLRHHNKNIHGVGFVLTLGDPYVAVDVDACVYEAGIDQAAVDAIEVLKSYTEISPSGHGIRILVACPELHDNARKAAIEVYSYSRYVTITGHHIAGTSPDISSASLDLIASLLPPTTEPVASPPARSPKCAVNDREPGNESLRMTTTVNNTCNGFKAILHLTEVTIRSR